MKTLAILQPQIPHYREDFFSGLSKELEFDLFSFKDSSRDRKYLKQAAINYDLIKIVKLWRFKWYNPVRFLLKYDMIVIPGELTYLTNWALLVAASIFKKNIIILGHGVNYARSTPIPFGYKLMYFLSSSAIFYTEKEMRIYRKIFPNKKFTYSNNTIAIDTDIINDSYRKISKDYLKNKHNIRYKKIFISCYRFTNPYRNDYELFKLIRKCSLQNLDVGFIIIGVGDLKPNFEGLNNVYDYGELYDDKVKLELFQLSDFYLQLGWTGLSVVEALAHKKPVVTLRRSKETKQSVEYFYLRNKYNALIMNNISGFDEVLKINGDELEQLSENAFLTYTKELQMKSMINHFKNHFNG